MIHWWRVAPDWLVAGLIKNQDMMTGSWKSEMIFGEDLTTRSHW